MLSRRNPSLDTALAAAAVFAWALWLRADGVSLDFWLMQDQVGDWQTVQGGFAALPFTGPAKTGGGTHLGPFFYWWLWLARHAFAPFIGPLPHAMGLAGSLLDAAAFALLVPAIESAGAPLLASFAAVLLASTVPYEAALARAGWNPCFALACQALALSLLLLGRWRMTAARAAIVAALAWAGVASHLSAIVVALPLLAGLVAAAGRRGPRAAGATAATVAAVVLAMLLPWFAAQHGLGTRAWTPGPTGDPASGVEPEPQALPTRDTTPGTGIASRGSETAVTRTVEAIGATPSRLLSPRGVSFVAVEAPALLLRSLWLPWQVSTALLLGAVVLVLAGAARARVDLLAALLALLPLVVAAAAYTAFDGALPAYFAIPLLAPLAVLVALAIAALPLRTRGIAGVVLLAATLFGQPHRLEDRRWEHSWRWYATTVRGAREIAARGTVVRTVEGPGGNAARGSATALARWLGASIDPGASAIARIERDGSVSWIGAP